MRVGQKFILNFYFGEAYHGGVTIIMPVLQSATAVKMS